MVDVSAKADTAREAVAAGDVRMRAETLERVRAGGIAQGDVLAVAQVAGILAAQRTAEDVARLAFRKVNGVARDEAESRRMDDEVQTTGLHTVA